ncbi:MAG: type II toxin-antitoxin system RelE/ParE family toxin [Rhodospirillales bacterium]|nr:type II toxin-antitoxin system RelE/ParE family toxin [Rhodospirillales bacterium]
MLAPQDEVCSFVSKDYPHAEEDAQHPSRSTRIIGAFCEMVIVAPYIIVYDVDDASDVSILRVWHAAQER